VSCGTVPERLADSGTPLTSAGTWGVVEILRYRGGFGHADLSEMARRDHLPAGVLEPAFAELAARGVITLAGDTLELTDQGEAEVARVTGAFRGWLAEQLADREDGPDAAQIGEALTDISRQLLRQDDEPRLPRALQPAPAAAG
jgi:hypothetical protein